MGIWGWLTENWFNVFGSAGIAGLWLAAMALRAEARARRSANLQTITAIEGFFFKRRSQRARKRRLQEEKRDDLPAPPGVDHVQKTDV